MTANPATEADALRDWLARRQWTQSDLARDLGLTRQYLHLVIRGNQRPSLTLASKIERVTGIPASAWVQHQQETGK